MVEERLRVRFGDYIGKAEVLIYSILAILLCVTALAATANAAKLLWESVLQRPINIQTLAVLEELLLVLMLVEVLHTVRISNRSHILVTEPFLVVRLIASIRRMLVITLEAAELVKGGKWIAGGASVFRWSMVELGLLGLLVLILVFCITLLRRPVSPSNNIEEQ